LGFQVEDNCPEFDQDPRRRMGAGADRPDRIKCRRTGA
jgi:hypothetical protein